jgi:hypothetical protein
MLSYAEIYLRNIYEVVLAPHNSIFFSLTDFRDSLFFDRTFAIITAHNPQNRDLPKTANRLLDQKLYSHLYSRYELLRARGCLEEHCEEGYLVYDITLDDAIDIGRRYSQYAIFYNSGDALSYISCEDKKVIIEKKRK